MSRRYPHKSECPDCGRLVMSNSKEARFHLCIPDAPWPYYTPRQTAQRLRVDVTYVDGLVNNPIPAVRVSTPKGSDIWLFEKAAVDAIVDRLGAAT